MRAAALLIPTLLLLCALLLPAQAEPFRVTIEDPYIDVHTGPGRGYPIFHVFQRGEMVELQARRTDWVRVRGAGDVRGWASLAQLERTLDGGGKPIAFPEPTREDYLNRRYELGAFAGSFDGDAAVGARAAYHASPLIAVQASFTHIPGDFSSSRSFNLDLVLSPLRAPRLEPTFSAGIGYFENSARPTLVDGRRANGMSAVAGVGLRSFLTRNFVIRADARRHFAFIDSSRDNEGFTELTAGFAAFF